MKVITPIAIAALSELVSTNVEDAGSVWAAGTAYALNAVVRLDPAANAFPQNTRYYKCIQAPATGVSPLAASGALYWADNGPTNQWAMFDSLTGTRTSRSTGLTFGLKRLGCTALALMGVYGATLTLTLVDSLGAEAVFFTRPTASSGEDIIITDIPAEAGTAYFRVTITGSAAVATVLRGQLKDLGPVEYGATLSITDYSKKTTDAYGVTTFVKRAFSKRLSARALFNNADLASVYRQLALVRSTPCVWLAVDSALDAAGIYQVLNVFGYYQSFNIEVAYPTQSYCSLEIEGLA